MAVKSVICCPLLLLHCVISLAPPFPVTVLLVLVVVILVHVLAESLSHTRKAIDLIVTINVSIVTLNAKW